jgi:hypothetical protein
MPAAASACTCSAGVPEAKRFAAADAAFVGVLENRRALDSPRPDGVMSTADRFVHRYRVQRRYKGRLGGKLWVRTVRDGAWHAGLCSTTTEAAIRAVVRRRDRSAQTAAVAACRRPA